MSEHSERAEELVRWADHRMSHDPTLWLRTYEQRHYFLAAAQVHATLAVAAEIRAASEARSALSASNTCSVALGDADDVEGPQNGAQSLGPELATADDVIEGRARYADTAGGRADRETLANEGDE